jgi:hypothetical protein
MPIRDVAMDVSARVGLRNIGRLFLIPHATYALIRLPPREELA